MLLMLTSSKIRQFLLVNFPQFLPNKFRHFTLLKYTLTMLHTITLIIHLNDFNPMEEAF